MKNFLQKFKKILGFPFTLLIIMALFLGVTLGTSGSVKSTGDAFELQYTTDSNRSWVVFKISAPKTVDEDGNETTMNVRLHDAYVNLGAIYSEEETATMELQWGSSSTEPENFFRLSKMKRAVLYNSAYVPVEGAAEKKLEDADNRVDDYLYRWVAPFGVTNLEETSTYRSLSSPIYFKLVLPNQNNYQNSDVLVNEIVFVGEVYKDSKGTGELVVLPVEIEAERSYVPADSKKEGLARAEALIDAQEMPVLSESSYYRYGDEEIGLLHSLAEMKMDSSYVPGDKYVGDRTYNSLGLCLSYLGTLIFGFSPFGLRFFNVLASFGILVVGFFFVKRLFKGSEKAGLTFAVIYALSGAAISLAHLATPVMPGVFFLLSSLCACYRYYANGMKKPSAKATVPLLISGLTGAMAVLVNGAFVIPVAGVAALFALGAWKQHRKNRKALDEAIAFAEEERAAGVPALAEDGTESEGNKKVRTALGVYRYDTAAASGVFACALILGIFLFSILLAIPVSYATNKIYNGLVGSPNLFTVAWRLFAAGFTGKNAVSGWNYLYPIFTGTGERYAVTLGVMNFAATLLGLLGIAFAVYRIVTLALKKASVGDYVNVIVPLAGLVLSLVTAAFAGGAIAFVLLANLFAFALVAGGGELFKEEGAKQAKAVFVVKIVALVLLIACFALLAVFTFSVPLPAAFMTKIF